MAPHLNGPVTCIRNGHGSRLTPLIHQNIARLRQNLARHHRAMRSADRIMDCHKLCPVGKRRLDLHIMDHFGDAIHHLIGSDHMGTCFHQISNRATVPRTFNHKIGDQRDGLGMVELNAAFQPLPRNHRRHRHKQLVFFTWRQVHLFILSRQIVQSALPDAGQGLAPKRGQKPRGRQSKRRRIVRCKACDQHPVPRARAGFT